EAIVRGGDLERFHRFEDRGPLGIELVECAGAGERELIGRAGEETRADLERGAIGSAAGLDVHLDPRAGIAALVHPVIAQARVAAERDAVERGAGITL